MICGSICRLSDNDGTIPNVYEMRLLRYELYNKYFCIRNQIDIRDIYLFQ